MEGKRNNINPRDLCGNAINRSPFHIFFIDILTTIPCTEFETTSRFISSVYTDEVIWRKVPDTLSGARDAAPNKTDENPSFPECP